ncbi:MAG: radical SAM protein [Patescibacteria group bacterium]|nr:radical SAM protein [Patescibacteria group bacterium]
MKRTYRWSDFNLRLEVKDGILLKNGLTGAVVVVDAETEKSISDSITNGILEIGEERLREFADPDTAILVSSDSDEYVAWRKRLIFKRNEEAHIFTIHFLPTIQCQLRCDYCIQKGIDRGRGMEQGVLERSLVWAREYLEDHSEIDSFRFVLFGGEPLLQKKLMECSLNGFHELAREKELQFWTEIVTNGEFLDESAAGMLSEHEWRRVQVTLDGPKDVHDARRHGENGRPTFENIMRTVRMLVTTDYIRKVDIRISLDVENGDRIPELIRELAELGAQDRINLSIGLITPTFASPERVGLERVIAEKALAAWKVAKDCGFTIPEEFLTGPWCVAIAKHSVVLQPDGTLQKCFCTAGRKEFDFGSVFDPADGYLKDSRFEHWQRTDECIARKCKFLPFCGGGCIYSAMVEHGGPIGATKRFCQKTLLDRMNHGLLALTYG